MIICKIDILNVQLVKIVDTNLFSAKSIQCCVYQDGKTLHTEAAAQTCSVKNVFLEISQNSKENTCAAVSFLIKLQVSGPQLHLKRDSGTGVFL